MKISIKTNIKELTKKLDDFAKKQVPFATAQALNSLAKHVALVEKKNIKAVFPTAKPFTVNAVGISKASKNNPTATIYMKDITAGYLRPYEIGGVYKVWQDNTLMLDPARKGSVKLNQYGGIPQGTFAQLKARSDVFEGIPKGWPSAPYGLWQRPFKRQAQTDVTANIKMRGKLRGRHALKIPKGANTTGKIRLLILMVHPHNVGRHLNWFALAQGCVNSRFNREFDIALRKAIATAK